MKKNFNISISGYKPAPESFTIFLNGKVYAQRGSQEAHDIALLFLAGKKKEAADHIKKQIRASYKKPQYITIGFMEEGSASRYFFTRQLYADRNSLPDKLRIYKEYKSFLQSNNYIVNTYEIKEAEFIPGKAAAATTKVIEEKADPRRPIIIKLV